MIGSGVFSTCGFHGGLPHDFQLESMTTDFRCGAITMFLHSTDNDDDEAFTQKIKLPHFQYINVLCISMC